MPEIQRKSPMNRKSFLASSGVILGAATLVPNRLIAEENPIFKAEEITEFVFAAHNDFDKTKRIIERKPLLLNCTNQFKKGDFETALGGASHMGRRDIADLLISKGARMDIFNMAFLGLDEQVRGMINAFPDYLNSPGPHGFTLLHHARVGKRDDLAAWLESKGLTETMFKGIFG